MDQNYGPIFLRLWTTVHHIKSQREGDIVYNGWLPWN